MIVVEHTRHLPGLSTPENDLICNFLQRKDAFTRDRSGNHRYVKVVAVETDPSQVFSLKGCQKAIHISGLMVPKRTGFTGLNHLVTNKEYRIAISDKLTVVYGVVLCQQDFGLNDVKPIGLIFGFRAWIFNELNKSLVFNSFFAHNFSYGNLKRLTFRINPLVVKNGAFVTFVHVIGAFNDLLCRFKFSNVIRKFFQRPTFNHSFESR